ncbi:hypothetical protein BGX33_010959 [Mortierella sp. NVP41]|nr:hypothetical protein BGX33_010959 [Mortierella sp. NVP41]
MGAVLSTKQHLPGDKQRTILSDFSPEIISLVIGYLQRKDVHSCVLASRSFSQSFAPYLWRSIDISMCYQRRPQLDHNDRFLRFKALSIDSGALSRNGVFIRSLKGFYVEWLDVFALGACPNLMEVDIGGYRFVPLLEVQARMSDDDGDDEGAVSELSKTLGVFLRGQWDRLRKLTLGRDILCSENEAVTLR